MHATFSGAGKGEHEVCASNERQYVCAEKGEQGMCASNGRREGSAGTEKGKEKTDEGSSVLLYFMTEEGERE